MEEMSFVNITNMRREIFPEKQKIRMISHPESVRETGLEPASSYEHMNLNHARLPIPPFPHGTEAIIQRAEGFVKGGDSVSFTFFLFF